MRAIYLYSLSSVLPRRKLCKLTYELDPSSKGRSYLTVRIKFDCEKSKSSFMDSSETLYDNRTALVEHTVHGRYQMDASCDQEIVYRRIRQ